VINEIKVRRVGKKLLRDVLGIKETGVYHI
jgi:hypothetical protein